MDPNLKNLEERIDADRRKQEALLLSLFLIPLFKRVRRQAYAAAQTGQDPISAVADVLYGNPMLRIPSPAAQLAVYLAAAERAGYRRTLLVLPGEPATTRGIRDWLSEAAQALSQLLAMLQRKIAEGVAVAKRGVSGVLTALRGVFVTGGYTRAGDNGPWRLRGAAETLVGGAYDAGYVAGLKRPELDEKVGGYRYSSVLDLVTTPICRAYDGVKLPKSHPWWNSHWPKNHWGCRAVVLPIIGAFEATENPPYVPPPMAGFGRAPFALYSQFSTRAA